MSQFKKGDPVRNAFSGVTGRVIGVTTDGRIVGTFYKVKWDRTKNEVNGYMAHDLDLIPEEPKEATASEVIHKIDLKIAGIDAEIEKLQKNRDRLVLSKATIKENM